MSTNPMQRQARNSFLLGMVITLIIAAIVVGLLFMQIKKLNEQIEADKAATKNVYVLNKDIKSGQVLTADLFTMKQVRVEGVPADATSDIMTTIQTYSLCDKSGNNIYTDTDGSLYMMEDGNKTQILQESVGTYYVQESNGAKRYIETTQKALVAKVDMKANTVITSSLMTRSDDIDTDDVRVQEYNMLSLPTDLMTGDYVDVRLMLPTGQDYIVTSKKMITVPMVGEEYLADTVQVKMAEEEILTMANAIVEAYKIEGSKLYVTKYTDAGIQAESSPTYVVNEEVANLIESDPNIVTEAMNALRARYNANGGKIKEMRNKYINSAIEKYSDDEDGSTIAGKMEESITSTQESRQEYLQSLTAVPTTTTTSTSSAQ